MEANLIDRDVAEDYFGCSDWEILAKETLREVPLVDAVPVVRCRECVSRGNSSNFPAMIYCKRLYCYKSPEGYCDEGQRKEAAHE